jgi:hypothetical protein
VAVQKLLGHQQISTTMRYAHLAPSTTRDAVRLLDSRVEPAWNQKDFTAENVTNRGTYVSGKRDLNPRRARKFSRESARLSAKLARPLESFPSRSSLVRLVPADSARAWNQGGTRSALGRGGSAKRRAFHVTRDLSGSRGNESTVTADALFADRRHGRVEQIPRTLTWAFCLAQ